MPCETFTLPPADTLILCANQRTAARWQQNYHRAQLAQHTLWEAPAIWALSHWLTTQWQTCLTAQGRLLSDLEELLWWQRLLAEDGMSRMAKLAQQAWQHLTLWGFSSEQLRDEPNTDVAHFYRWAQQFEALTQSQQVISQASLPAQVLTLLQAQAIALPTRVMAVGFDTLTPSVARLFEYLAQHCEWLTPPDSLREPLVQRCQLEHQEDEIKRMAWWAKHQHQANPRQLIGCVVPNLSALRNQVAQQFEEVFAPEATLANPPLNLPYNLSAGLPFGQVPLVKTALELLACWLKPSLALMQSLLLSPYLCSGLEDRCVAAMTWQSITQENVATPSVSYLATQAGCQASRHFPDSQLAKRLTAWAKCTPITHAVELTAATQLFEEALLAAGWPGQRNPTSAEYQVIERWHHLLLELSQLSTSLGPMSLSDALQLLQTLAQETVFQAKTDEQPIQILGLLEASGGEFDQLWIMGLHDEAWPPKAEPNPFLPIALQRQQAMPHASAQRELAFCLEVQQRLLQSANQVWLSSPRREGDKLLQPSPLIYSWPLVEAPLAEYQQHVSDLPAETLMAWEDPQGPALTEQENAPGGSRILQLQAECPFRAFASIRLRAEPLAYERIGIPKPEQGTLTHLALEYTWKTLKSQQALLGASRDELATITQQAITTAIQHSRFQTGHFLAVERQRLQRLLQQWLTVERDRPTFVVREHETQRHVSFGHLRLTLKIDRIDALEDGSHLIIDYKTGQYQSVQDWLGERLRQPQLPLYALLMPSQVAGICYAQVTPLNPQFKGIADAHASFRGLQTAEKVTQQSLSWGQLQQHWQYRVQQLSEEFCAGHASVTPLDANSCRLCQLQPLCRIGEHA